MSSWGNPGGRLKIGIMASGYPELAHECCHAANEVFACINQELDCNKDETYCYLVEWLFKTYTDHIKFKRPKR